MGVPGDNSDPSDRDRQGKHLREDEFKINFKDDRVHASKFWAGIASATRKGLSAADYRIAGQIYNLETLGGYVANLCDTETPQARQMASISGLPGTLDGFLAIFEKSVDPFPADMSLVWNLIYYNIKLSVESHEKLRLTTTWLKNLRRTLEQCSRCMESCEDDNEVRLAWQDILDPLLSFLEFSVKCLLNSNTDGEYLKSWPQVDKRHRECLKNLDDTIRHLNEIKSYSKVNQEREVRFLSIRTEQHPEQEERVPFPIRLVPLPRNKEFYGREDELIAINEHLGKEKITSLLTYTIYGRRGVGKTHLALEYCFRNPGKFDAIFWLRCETSASLRQSIADIATGLDLPRAAEPGHFEENLVGTQTWLKKTKKRWLLVFDNAEKDQLLTGYWPIGARGSILITSRSHYNFMKDSKRMGETVPLFETEESLEMLLKFLGQSWQQKHLVEPFKESDLAAARPLVDRMGGLVLAVHHAATLIGARDCSIRHFLDLYMEEWNRLPARQLGSRDPLIHSLDTIWSIAFSTLSENARTFLGILGFLAPDRIQVDLFLPQNQTILRGKLEFCRMSPDGQEDIASLASVIDPPPGLQSVLNELTDAQLIRPLDGRNFLIHRVIQEAINYQNFDDLQESFNAAVLLVYEAFPKQQGGDPLYDQWSDCEHYVQHALLLYTRFNEYSRAHERGESALSAIVEFLKLGSNCGWYLLEIADYEECIAMVKAAQNACDSQGSLLVADLRNTAASARIELNELRLCRKEYEICRSIREEKLPPNDKEVASILANLANLETSEENFDEARILLERAATIRRDLGDSAAIHLALTHLQIGRVDSLVKDYPAALKSFQKAEALFNRQIGARDYLADLQFAYGNLEYSRDNYDEAIEHFKKCHDLAKARRPLHPIVGAACYKLGSCEFELSNYEKARDFLYKALNIAEIRNPGRDDGTVARILWKLSQVLKEMSVYIEEAEEMENRALMIRKAFIGRTGAEDTYDDGELYDDMEHSYDILVSVFFR